MNMMPLPCLLATVRAKVGPLSPVLASFSRCLSLAVPVSVGRCFSPCLSKSLFARTFFTKSKTITMSTLSTVSNMASESPNTKHGETLTKVLPLLSDMMHDQRPASHSHRLIWVDLEMTGLDFVNDRILEIACVITEGDLRIVAEGPHLIIHESDEVLSNMGDWCREHHGQSGLTEAVRSSKISLGDAEQMVLEFVRKHTPKGVCPLAGNTIGMDKSFVERYMPQLAEHLHHRVVDVSTVKELCRRWFPEQFQLAPVKRDNHRAKDDILESIAELTFYRSVIFK